MRHEMFCELERAAGAVPGARAKNNCAVPNTHYFRRVARWRYMLTNSDRIGLLMVVLHCFVVGRGWANAERNVFRIRFVSLRHPNGSQKYSWSVNRFKQDIMLEEDLDTLLRPLLGGDQARDSVPWQWRLFGSACIQRRQRISEAH